MLNRLNMGTTPIMEATKNPTLISSGHYSDAVMCLAVYEEIVDKHETHYPKQTIVAGTDCRSGTGLINVLRTASSHYQEGKEWLEERKGKNGNPRVAFTGSSVIT